MYNNKSNEDEMIRDPSCTDACEKVTVEALHPLVVSDEHKDTIESPGLNEIKIQIAADSRSVSNDSEEDEKCEELNPRKNSSPSIRIESFEKKEDASEKPQVAYP